MSWEIIADESWAYAIELRGNAEALADWVEIKALIRNGGVIDQGTLEANLKQSSDDWALAHWPNNDDGAYMGDAIHEARARKAFEILLDRHSRTLPGYPFAFHNGTLSLSNGADVSLYLFLLGLSYKNPKEGRPASGAKIFERLGALSIERMVGEPPVSIKPRIAFSAPLGHPRDPHMPESFYDAVDLICSGIHEGSSHRIADRRAQVAGDGGMDILVARRFNDRRGSSLLVVGNCAAGRTDWDGAKTSELCIRRWFSAHTEIGKIKSERAVCHCFLIPRVVPDLQWDETATAGGLVLDRFRILELLHDAPQSDIDQCGLRDWLAWAGLDLPH